MELAEECEDPWALLSAVRAVDAFLEHRTAGTLDRARIAVSRVDDLANHPWLHEGTQEYLDGMVAAMKKARDHEEAMRLGNEFDKRIRGEGKHLFVSPEHADLPEKIAKKAQELSIQHGGDYSGHVLAAAMSFGFPAATMTENKSIFTIQPAIEVLDEDLDFAIEEKLTYNGFRVVLTEAFEHDVGRALSKLEKNPSLLDELASSLRSINDIAHHYDQHSVHMKESTLDEDWAGKSLAGGLIALNVAAAGLAGYTGHEQYKEHSFRTRLEKTAPADYTEYKKHNDAYYSQLVVAGKATYNKDPELAKKSQAAMDAIKAKHKELTESSEDKAIEHAEKTKRITLRKISSGPQVIKIAKRAAVELIAQKLAGKPVKKISKKEKNVIVDAIKKKKGVVMKLVKKLVPKIRAIEASSAEHEHESEDRGSQEFGSAGS